MPRFSNALLIGAAVLIAIVASVIFFTQFGRIKSAADRSIAVVTLDDIDEESSRVRRSNTAISPRRSSSMRTAQRLRQRLEERTEEYRKQKSQLALQSKQHDELSTSYKVLVEKFTQLQRAYDELLVDADASLISLIDQIQKEDQVATNEDDSQPVELDELGDPLEEETTTSDIEAELEFAVWELEQSNLRVAALRAEAARESRVSMASSSVLVEIGEPAIPLITPMLDDQGPEIRAWAAWMLGYIRPISEEAKSALMRMTRDDDADVAKAADDALARIEKQ